MEINHINNEKMKIKIANTAISVLLNNQKITKEDLSKIKLGYGYIFQKEDGKLEALFRIICDANIYYFALQNEKIMLVNLSKEQYAQTVNYMKTTHECLKTIPVAETEIQKNRREKNNQYLKENNITINEKLVNYIKDENAKIKSLEKVCKRAITSLITVQIAIDINNGNYKESLEYFLPMYKKYGVEECLNSKEKRIIDGTYTEQDIIDMDWAYEAYWSLCWYLGLVDDIKDGGKLCDCEKAISFVSESNTLEEFMNKCQVRSIEVLLDMHDLYFRYNWATTHKRIDANTSIGNLNPSNVIERRRGLEWLISEKEDWYQIEMNT